MDDVNVLIAQIDDAINRDDGEEVIALLAAGVDPNASDAGGDRLLSSAAWIGSPRVLQILLDAGADPRLTNRDGLTPLDRLLQNEEFPDEGHEEVRRILESRLR